MTDRPILLISHEPGLADSIARDLGPQSGLRVMNVEGVDRAIELMGREECSLIMIHFAGTNGRDQIDGLLWSCSRARRPVPTVALGDRYDEAEALTLFRMGVTDYLSLSDHRENLPGVILSLVSTQTQEHGHAVGDERSLKWDEAARTHAVSQLS